MLAREILEVILPLFEADIFIIEVPVTLEFSDGVLINTFGQIEAVKIAGASGTLPSAAVATRASQVPSIATLWFKRNHREIFIATAEDSDRPVFVLRLILSAVSISSTALTSATVASAASITTAAIPAIAVALTVTHIFQPLIFSIEGAFQLIEGEVVISNEPARLTRICLMDHIHAISGDTATDHAHEFV